MSSNPNSNPLAAAMAQHRPQQFGPNMQPPAPQGSPFQPQGGPNTMFRPNPNPPMTPPGMGQPAPQMGWNGRPLNMPDLGTFGTGGNAQPPMNQGQPGVFRGLNTPRSTPLPGLDQGIVSKLFGGSSKGMPNIQPSL